MDILLYIIIATPFITEANKMNFTWGGGGGSLVGDVMMSSCGGGGQQITLILTCIHNLIENLENIKIGVDFFLIFIQLFLCSWERVQSVM